MGGREGKKRRLPGLLRARGSSTGSRPLAAAVRRSVRGDVRRRAWEWAGAQAAAATWGQIWRLASQCERREGNPEARHCARAGCLVWPREPGFAAPPSCSRRRCALSHEVVVSAWAEKSLVIVTGFVPDASRLRKSRILGRFSLTLSVLIGVP